MAENIVIAVDPDVLRRAATDLDGIAGVSERAGRVLSGAPTDASALGSMNSWMVPPITGLAEGAERLAGVTSKIAAAVGAAARHAARDFEETESTAIARVDALEAEGFER